MTINNLHDLARRGFLLILNAINTAVLHPANNRQLQWRVALQVARLHCQAKQ